MPGDGPTRHIPLPTVVADGRKIEFRVKRAGLRSLDVSLLYHPGWEIAHPLEADGRALRLWPREVDSGVADSASLQPVHPQGYGLGRGANDSLRPGCLLAGRSPSAITLLQPYRSRAKVNQ